MYCKRRLYQAVSLKVYAGETNVGGYESLRKKPTRFTIFRGLMQNFGPSDTNQTANNGLE